MREAVITGGARTAVGRLLGSLKDFTAAQLGGVVIKSALERAGLSGDQADYVIMGQVLQAGAGQNPTRQAAVAGGIPMSVPSLTINKVCLSGLDAIALAAQLIRAGEFDVVVAGGMESMTGAPHLLPGARAGYKYGSIELLDAMARDGLTDAFDHLPMGELTDRHNARLGISRAEQDEFAAQSHQRAATAIKDGLLAGEIVGIPVPQRRGEPVVFDQDEGVRPDTTAEALSGLRPAFAADGTITAASSSQISDGAAAVVVMSAEAAARRGAPVLATVGAHGVVAGPDTSLQSQPSACDPARARQGRPGRVRPGPDRDQRGVRCGRHPVHAGPGRRGREGQRERRGHRAGPPDRGVRRPDRPAPGARAGPPRWRAGRGRAVRRRRPGQRAAARGACAAARADPGLRGSRALDPGLVKRARDGDPRALGRPCPWWRTARRSCAR